MNYFIADGLWGLAGVVLARRLQLEQRSATATMTAFTVAAIAVDQDFVRGDRCWGSRERTPPERCPTIRSVCATDTVLNFLRYTRS